MSRGEVTPEGGQGSKKRGLEGWSHETSHCSSDGLFWRRSGGAALQLPRPITARDATSQQPVGAADQADATTPPERSIGSQLAVPEGPRPACTAPSSRPPPRTESAVAAVPSGSPTRLTPPRWDRRTAIARNPHCRRTKLMLLAMVAPARLANRRHSDRRRLPIGRSANPSTDADPEPADSQLLAMADGDAAPAAVGIAMNPPRRGPVTAANRPFLPDCRRPPKMTAASPAAIGRLPARPRDRTMQPDRPATTPACHRGRHGPPGSSRASLGTVGSAADRWDRLRRAAACRCRPPPPGDAP